MAELFIDFLVQFLPKTDVLSNHQKELLGRDEVISKLLIL